MALSVTPNFTPDVKTYTSSATWTKPNGATFVYVKAIGGGGGGGGASTTIAGFGGAGAGATEFLFLASALPTTVSITIGSGGSGGSGATNGGDGTGTTFGTYLRSGRGYGGQTGGAVAKNNSNVSGAMGVQSSAGAATMNQLNTMMQGVGSHGCNSTSIRSAFDCLYGAAGGGIGSTGGLSGNGGAGFWCTLSTSVDMISPLESSVRSAGTAYGNGALGATGGIGANGANATRLGDGGGGGDFNSGATGGKGGSGYLGGGGGGGGIAVTTGGNGGAGGNGYCLVYSW